MRRTEIISVKLNNGILEVVIRERSNTHYVSGSPCPDAIRKEFYGAVDGEVQLIKSVVGTHVPAKTLPERFVFED